MILYDLLESASAFARSPASCTGSSSGARSTFRRQAGSSSSPTTSRCSTRGSSRLRRRGRSATWRSPSSGGTGSSAARWRPSARSPWSGEPATRPQSRTRPSSCAGEKCSGSFLRGRRSSGGIAPTIVAPHGSRSQPARRSCRSGSSGREAFRGRDARLRRSSSASRFRVEPAKPTLVAAKELTKRVERQLVGGSVIDHRWQLLLLGWAVASALLGALYLVQRRTGDATAVDAGWAGSLVWSPACTPRSDRATSRIAC